METGNIIPKWGIHLTAPTTVSRDIQFRKSNEFKARGRQMDTPPLLGNALNMSKAKKTAHNAGKYLQRRKAIDSMPVDEFMEETFSPEFIKESEKDYKKIQERTSRSKT